MTNTINTLISAAVLTADLSTASLSAHAEGPNVEATYADIEKTIGGVPSFVKQVPRAAIGGAWLELKELELSDTTALPPKTKVLISLAVAAQIPCTYCVWADTNTARQLGATDEEIGEAVAMAGLTRNWSTLFNGLQVDFDQFKKEMGGQ
ncbi:MAG: carboxymuconolactone decarboxylase family protein [Alphaproteobacteria bacterium]|nr:carboxymuconolactone decarboxylase family protein [Alphaproteobacteria bacterium]